MQQFTSQAQNTNSTLFTITETSAKNLFYINTSASLYGHHKLIQNPQTYGFYLNIIQVIIS